MQNIDYEILIKPFKGEKASGDIGVVNVVDDKMYIAAIDVAGHGEKAATIATKVKELISENFVIEPIEFVKELHKQLKGTRGCAGGFGILNLETGVMKYVGVGNIRAKIIGENNKQFINRAGVIGYMLPTLQEESSTINKNDILLLYSDGIKEFFKLDFPSSPSNITAKDIATKVMDEFSQTSDDCMCMAIKYDL